MCGRFTLTYRDVHLLAEELGVPAASLAGYGPHYNIAPTQQHFVVRMKGEERQALQAKWGLVNSWAKDAARAARAINARAETVGRSPSFRDAYARRRCVVPADGFFEWEGPKARRQPYWVHRKDGHLLLLAGLYESWQPTLGEWERTFTIVTTRPNELVSAIHDRMPVVLDDEEAGRWMLANTPERELQTLMEPPAEGMLTMIAVSPRVNRVDNDDASLLEPVAGTSRLV